MNTESRDELLELCEAVREQTVSEAEWQRLHQLLRDPEARRLYTDYMAMVGHLGETLEDFSAVRGGDPNDARQLMLDALLEKNVRNDQATTVVLTRQPWKTLATYTAALSVLAVLLWGGFTVRGKSESIAFASVSSSSDCKWGSGTLPTAVGSRLTTGRLDLLEGYARIGFDNGVQLMLEAPVAVSLKSRTECQVHSGQILAHVPGPEIGFTVTTPTAEVLDLGTEFAVRVEDDGLTGVHVLSGEVDVTNLRSKESQRLTENQIASVGNGEITRPGNGAESLSERPGESGDGFKKLESRLISTAQGGGRDAFIWREYSSGYEGPEMLMVKQCVARRSDWDRKVYLAFDIEALDGFKIEQAELRLNLVPSGLGYVTGHPDVTFQVYGLVDESLDGWSEETINWQNAPANETDAASVSPEMTVPAGSFMVRQGVQTGSVSVAGDRIRDFIDSDTNGIITLIVVSDTKERHRHGGGLVHAFTSKEHPSGVPPMLRLIGSEELAE